MPRPSLVDEIEQLAADAFHYAADADDWRRFRSRLTEIEQELEGYRQRNEIAHRMIARLLYSATVNGRDCLIEQGSPALPCTSEYVNAQSDITGEDLG